MFLRDGGERWSAVVAGSQATSAVSLSASLRAHINDERFQVVSSIRGLPLGVRDGLQSLFGSQSPDIAEPGAPFQVTSDGQSEAADSKARRCGCSADHCLVYYERGGIAHIWQVALFHWTAAATGSQLGTPRRQGGSVTVGLCEETMFALTEPVSRP